MSEVAVFRSWLRACVPWCLSPRVHNGLLAAARHCSSTSCCYQESFNSSFRGSATCRSKKLNRGGNLNRQSEE
ncbi:hypothetical protein ABBQ32_006874 [Trebouxia sp. C0010 RCD-2024]